MTEEKKIVRFWRGTRDGYNMLREANMLDYWTRYTVKEASGDWTEYYGSNPISMPTGQLLPVIDIVSSLPSDLHPGDRYLVGQDAKDGQPADYYLVEIYLRKDDKTNDWKQDAQIKKFDDKYSVRVRKRGLMTYQIVDGVMKTYDQVDCGTY